MFNLIVFIISLILLVLLFVMKSLEIYYGRKIFLERQFQNFDAWLHRVLLKIKFAWKQINFRNAQLIFSWLLLNIRRGAVAIKRRFDHKQSHFFTKREYDASKSKGTVSFFLKDVSDYKKTLRQEREGSEDVNK